MLVLTRKIGQAIHLGEDIQISVQDVKGSQVRIGIEAPNSVRIYRDEIYQEILNESKKALEQTIATSLPSSPQESLKKFSSQIKSIDIKIESGLIGFSDWQDYELSPAKIPFYWLKSKNKEELKFLLIPITDFKDKFYKDYSFDKDSEIFCLVSPKENFLDSSVSLKAPLVLNSVESSLTQLIIDQDSIELKLTLAELLSIALT